MIKYLLESYKAFPLMQTEDFIKLIYQAEYGCEHMLDTNTENRLKEECMQLPSSSISQPIFDTISKDLVRVNLLPYANMGYSLSTLSDMMKSVKCSGSIEGLERRLSQFIQLVEQHRIDLPVYSVKRTVTKYREDGYGYIRHSSAYRMNYQPHYRVVSKMHAQLLPVIASIDRMLYHKMNIIVAIDGNSCSGKSFYATALSNYYNNCNIIHCDDFFLPPDMRSKQRLDQVGGNIHYERLKQVLTSVTRDAPFVYQAYNCHSNGYSDISIEPKRLTIVEGSYSLHSQLTNFYSLGIVLSVDAIEQRYRVSVREDRDSYCNYINKWIPLENKYLNTLCDKDYIRINTSLVQY